MTLNFIVTCLQLLIKPSEDFILKHPLVDEWFRSYEKDDSRRAGPSLIVRKKLVVSFHVDEPVDTS